MREWTITRGRFGTLRTLFSTKIRPKGDDMSGTNSIKLDEAQRLFWVRWIVALRLSRPFLGLVGLALLAAVLSVISPHFLTVSNTLNVLRQVSVISIIAVGMTYVIITGGIDLSVGSVLALTSVVTAILLNQGVNPYLAIGAGLVLGAVLGALSGILVVSRIRMPPFISTLAMMSVARGLTMVITGGRPIYGLPEQFGFIGGGYVFGIPVPVIVMLVVFAIGHVDLSYTARGAYYYAVGGNEEATRLSGVNTSLVKLRAYMISGATAALAGVVLASRLTSVEPTAGTGYELDAIAATVIGGASLFGGEGTLVGTFVGALIMGVLRNGLNLLDVSTYWQQVVVGVVIAVMVSIGTFRRK